MPRFDRILLRFVLLLCIALPFTANDAHGQGLAPTPPMGWNSWDAYGLTIDETDFKANVTVLAGLKKYGWQYAVIDEGWYMEDPFGGSVEKEKFVFDANGRLIPALNRFPSAANGAGLKPLADWVHAQGLKFGIHLIRGIPRQDVRNNVSIAGSSFTAADAADTSDVCPWNEDAYGVRDNAAGQAWYDSMIGFYANWGVDYLKVDCISDHPYKASEIRQIAQAIKKSGRPIVLSLSPGPTQLEHAEEVGQYAQMWRISDDHWDVWSHAPKPGEGEFPFGTLQAFSRLVQWRGYVKPGNWPDDDMLPFGSLTPHPGWGEPRESRLTHDEERTEFTLWVITHSPLILGANLTKLDDFTRSLFTNEAVLRISRSQGKSHPIITLPAGFEHVRSWVFSGSESVNSPEYLALFNIDDKPVHLRSELGNLSEALSHRKLISLWDGTGSADAGILDLTLAPHACALYRAEFVSTPPK